MVVFEVQKPKKSPLGTDCKNLSSRFELARNILQSQKNKKVMFFSIFLHDIGKGLKGDHCQRGVEIAGEISKQFKFNKTDSGEIAWLIKNHLIFL